MQGIPIKFRGVNIATDKYVYGYYSVMYSPYITSSEKADEYSLYQVYPESVAQLVGYDVDGNEVYEGDVLKDFEDNSYTATLEARVEWKDTETDSEFYSLPLEQWKNFEKANQEKSLAEKGK